MWKKIKKTIYVIFRFLLIISRFSIIGLWVNAKTFLKFDWLSKKFFIRSFLLTILITMWYGLLNMVKTGKPDYGFIGSLIAITGTLLGMYTYRKSKE